jgi:hypothetical protein
VPSLLLRFIPERGGVVKWDRHWITTVLTTQVAVGAALGIDAQVFLTVVILGYVMPLFGLELLDVARDVAAFNLPTRVGLLLGSPAARLIRRPRARRTRRRDRGSGGIRRPLDPRARVENALNFR